jgi:hypothetical protein
LNKFLFAALMGALWIVPAAPAQIMGWQWTPSAGGLSWGDTVTVKASDPMSNMTLDSVKLVCQAASGAILCETSLGMSSISYSFVAPFHHQLVFTLPASPPQSCGECTWRITVDFVGSPWGWEYHDVYQSGAIQ